MRPLKSDDIRGTWGTLLLPIQPDDSIDYMLLTEEIDRLIESGVAGIYSNGTAGEMYNQTEAEFDRISGILAERCERTGVPFQLGVSHMSPMLSLERLRRVIPLAPGAVQVALPDWFRPSVDECMDFLQRMAEVASPIPLVLYNPPHAKRVLSPAEIGQLARAVPALVGVKVADGDEGWYERMRVHCSGLSVFVPGHHLATGRTRGAGGSYSNVACLNPAAAQRWWRQMHDAPGEAVALQGRIEGFLEQYILPLLLKGYSTMAVDKLLAAIGHWCRIDSRLRWPYRWIDEETADHLRSTARECLPEFFSAEVLCP